ncbi:unnamed protein product, partial [Staurois parvus]
MICVAPAAHLSVSISATSVPIISATSMPHISAHLPFSVIHQCQSVPPISAPITNQCRLSVPYMSAAFQCPSMMPVNARQCHLPVPPHQCHLS